MKDQQSLGFWMLDDCRKYGKKYKYSQDSLESMVVPFWKYFSDKLSTIYDAVSEEKYNPLHLDLEYWKAAGKKYKYGSSSKEVLTELYSLSMKYASMKDIIYESNPDSLLPIVAYNASVFQQVHESENQVIAENNDGFWISGEYDSEIVTV